MSSGDVDAALDPGYSYYQFDFIIDGAVHRTLYSYKPTDTTAPSPDLATGPAQISDGGKTVTVHIKTGVKFSPPVNRDVTSADIKYAMERDFLPQVANGYATADWGDIIGSKEYAAGKAKEITGIQTPDPQRKKVAETALTTFQALGFKMNLEAVERATMYSKFCSVPKAKVAVCPSVGWLKDFADAQTVLDPTFNGKNILPSNNSNWPQLNDPKINAAMDQAETILDPSARASAWGKIDGQVTAAAPGILWLWDKGPSIESKNVNGVLNQENAAWDLSFTSLK